MQGNFFKDEWCPKIALIIFHDFDITYDKGWIEHKRGNDESNNEASFIMKLKMCEEYQVHQYDGQNISKDHYS